MRCSSLNNTHRSRSPVLKALSVALIMLAAATNLQAEVSVSTHISTIGPGIELGYKLSPAFGVRAGWQKFATDFDFKPEDENGVPGDELRYEGDLNLENGSLLADIGELRIAIDFEASIAPYIGIGWAFQRNQQWYFNADLGIAYLGAADVDIQSSGSCNDTSACRAQLDDEERELEKDMESLELFPVAKLGIGYRF